MLNYLYKLNRQPTCKAEGPTRTFHVSRRYWHRWSVSRCRSDIGMQKRGYTQGSHHPLDNHGQSQSRVMWPGRLVRSSKRYTLSVSMIYHSSMICTPIVMWIWINRYTLLKLIILHITIDIPYHLTTVKGRNRNLILQ